MVGLSKFLGIDSQGDETRTDSDASEETELSDPQSVQIMSDHLTQRVLATVSMALSKLEFKNLMLSMSLGLLREPHPDEENLNEDVDAGGAAGGGRIVLGTLYPEEEALLCSLLSSTSSVEEEAEVPLHEECARAGVTQQQWSRLVRLKRIKAVSSAGE